MFNAATFAKMKRGSIFINCARGGIVVQDDLTAALKSGHIRRAGVDVTSPEPLPADHPWFSEDMRDKIVVLPHIGSATYPTRNLMCSIAVDNALAGLSDLPLRHSVC